MAIRLLEELRFRARRVVFPTLVAFILFYIIYHLLSGQRGVMVWLNLRSQVSELEQQNVALEDQIKHLQSKIDRLQGETLDPDYVDEQIRRNLPMMHENETVLFKK